jgi:hypothetical protein
MNYTIADVLKELKKITCKSRKRELVDQRSYLIGLLYYRFKLTEEDIASLTTINRNKVHYNKKLPVTYKTNFDYIKHTQTLIEKYPYDFPESKKRKIRKVNKNACISIRFSAQQKEKLKKIQKILTHTDITITVRHLIRNSLKNKLWEE